MAYVIAYGYDEWRLPLLKCDGGNPGGLFGLNAGFGIRYRRYNFDYSYSPSGDFTGAVQRFTLALSF